MANNWRFAGNVPALKGLEAVLVSVLLERKYGLAPQEVVINPDHASLFLMTYLIREIDCPSVDSPVQPTELRELNQKHSNCFPI